MATTPSDHALPDDVLQLILEDKKSEAVATLRTRLNLGLRLAWDAVKAAEEDLGLMQDATCPTCRGHGTIRVRRAEYDPTGRDAIYREGVPHG